MKTKWLYVIFAGALFFALPAWSATLHVAETGADGNDGSTWGLAKRTIQGALDVPALDGDVILVSNGTYTVAAGAQVVYITRSVELRGVNGPDVTIIDGGNTKRCVYVYSTTAGNPICMSGFTIQNGATNTGAGVTKSGYRDFYLSNCVVHANTASAGAGGVYKTSNLGQMFANDCVISNNTAGTYGGGVQVSSSACFLERCHIVDNRAVDGGGGLYATAVSYTGTVFEARHCLFARNSATIGAGGGINHSLREGGTGVVSHCEIEYNTAATSGGGIWHRGGTTFVGPLFITNSIVRYNESAYGSGYAGGGVCILGNGRMVGCLIHGNKTTSVGGYGAGVAVNNPDNVYEIENVTIVSNTAANQGGGLAAPADVSATTIRNSIIYNNDAPVTVRANLYVGLGAGIIFTNCCTVPLNNGTDQPVTPNAGNIDLTPRFVNPPAGDFRLQPVSPCVNAGAIRPWMLAPDARDLDGRQRVDRFSRQVDMGCYEYIAGGTVFRFQ